MLDTYVEFAGIKLRVDPINRPRSDRNDNVMAIFQEEQPFTWGFCQPYIAEVLKIASGTCGFLDVGCGGGVFSILIATHFPGTRIIALDKNARAIKQTRRNMGLNNVSFETKTSLYSLESLPEHSVRVIGIYPPYHLYPKSLAKKVPLHARGGSYGQGEFKSQLAIAAYQLADGGIIFFNQMCLGNDFGPAFLEYIPQLVTESSLHFTNVFPRIQTGKFLLGVYGDRHKEFVSSTSERWPWLYYTVGIIRRDGKSLMEEVPHSINLDRSWADRIELHRQIALHEFY